MGLDRSVFIIGFVRCSNGSPAKAGVSHLEPNLALAIRTTIVVLFAWLMVGLLGDNRGIEHMDRQSWIFLKDSGLATGLSWLCYSVHSHGASSKEWLHWTNAACEAALAECSQT